MTTRHWLPLLTASALMTAAQEPQTLPGTNLKFTIKLSELTAEYQPLKLKEQSSGVFGEYYSSSYFQFASLGLGGGGLENKRLQELFEILPVAWTRSELVKVYGQDFVVTYIIEPSIESLREFAKGKPLEVTELKLKLMKADQIGSIEPFPELSREKYFAILGRLGKKGEGAVSSATRTVALSNVKQLALGVMIYLSDYDDIYPYVQSTKTLQRVTEPYVKNRDLWKNKNPRGGELRFNMSLAGARASDVPEASKTPLIYDPVAWPDGKFLVAYADSSARFVAADQWRADQKNLKLKLKRRGKPIK